jgi:hypothetical protein
VKKIVSSLLLFTLLSHGSVADELLEKSEQVQRLYQENIATFAIFYAEAAQAGDLNRILKLSCMQLRLTADYIDPQAYTAEDRVAEASALKANGTALKEELESRGLCD